MTDPVLALILIVAFFAAMAAASYFKTLDSSLATEARVPIVAGIAAGILIRLAAGEAAWHPILAGIILTVAALYVRLTGRESEPADGMTLGAMMGAAAAATFVFRGGDELLRFAECVAAGAVAGYGITFGLTHVRDKLRQAAIDGVTAIAAIGAAWLPSLVRARVGERTLAYSVGALLPLLLVAVVFKQWPAVRAELSEEAALNVIGEEDVRATAHPLLRLGRAGWHDAGAHREFVRIANRVALRKRQQRGRAEDVARLYQLEVIKLRMELQEMARIDRAMRAAAADAAR